MRKLHGNTSLTLSVTETTTNTIGEQVKSWRTVKTVKGWLDFRDGNANTATYHAKIEQSTHVFLCDWFALPTGLTAETARATVDGKHYNVLLIDDPMNLRQHYEIYLKLTDGQ